MFSIIDPRGPTNGRRVDDRSIFGNELSSCISCDFIEAKQLDFTVNESETSEEDASEEDGTDIESDNTEE